MKTIKYLLSICIAVLALSMHVKAEAAPVIDSGTFTLINGGTSHLLDLNGLQYGFWSMLPGDLGKSISSIVGEDISLKPEDYHIRPLSAIEKENLEEGFVTHFYDSEGNEYDLDSIYYVEASNGYFQTEFYMDSNGNCLYEDPNHTHVLVNLGLLPFESQNPNFASWPDVFTHLQTELLQNNFNFSPDGYNLTNYSYLVFAGTTSGGHPSTASYIYIPNQYNVGVTVPVTSNGYINQWYTNNLNTIIYKEVLGSSGWYSVYDGPFTKDGVQYAYRVVFASGMNFGGLSVNNTYDSWINGNNRYNTIFNLYGQNYNNYSYQHSYGFYSVEGSTMPNIVENEMYDYNEVQNLQPDLTTSVNPDFDPSANPSGDNVPIEVIDPLVNPVINPSTLPLPNSNPNINPVPQPSTDNVTDITNSTINGNIPILENLKNRFPFSIPWDLKRIFTGLSATREAPNFHFEIYLPIIEYTWIIDVDLSVFNGQAQIFRNCFLILFIISLAIFAYNHYFGS